MTLIRNLIGITNDDEKSLVEARTEVKEKRNQREKKKNGQNLNGNFISPFDNFCSL